MKNSRIQEFGVPSESNGVGAKALKRASIDHVNVNAHVEKRNLHRTLFAVTIFVVMLALGLIAVSCGKSGKSLVSSVNQGGTGGSPVDVQNGDRVTMSIAGPLGGEFVFEPLDGDGTPDEKGEDAYQLNLEAGKGDKGQDVLNLTITAEEGYDWKYALGYLHYDAEKYNPIEFKQGSIFGEDEQIILTHSVFCEKGLAAFWTGFTKFDDREPAKSGLIGTFVIELSPWEPPRGPSAAPDGDDTPPELCDKVDDLLGTEISNTHYIFWSEVNRGDGDIDGEVGIPDITPLAQNWGGNVELDSSLEVVDYFGDLHIQHVIPPPGDYDIISAEYNYGKTIGGYHIEVYSDENMQNLHVSTDVPGPDSNTRTAIASYTPGVMYGTGNYFLSTTGQVGYRLAHASYQNLSTAWAIVTPYDAETPSNDGIESELQNADFGNKAPKAVLYPAYDVVIPPYMLLLTASGSFDSDGTITKYEWDLDGDTVFETDTDDTPYTFLTIMSTGDYTVGLRVTDNGTLTNTTFKAVHAREHLNEVGFASDTADVLLENTTYTDYSIPIVIRDTSDPLAAIANIRIEFSGDTDNLIGIGSTDIKALDGYDTQWGNGQSGFLDPLYTGNGYLKLVIYQSLIADLNLSYIRNEREVDYDTTDNAIEIRFHVTKPHDPIYLKIIYDSDWNQGPQISFYTDLNLTYHYFYPWSNFPYLVEGFETAICPAHE